MNKYAEKRDQYIQKTQALQIKIAQARALNEQFEEVQKRVIVLKETYLEAKEHYDALDYTYNAVDREYIRYKNKIIKNLETVIDSILAKFYPNKGFTAELSVDLKRNKNQVKLVLYDKHNNKTLPHLGEGKLCQYLISFGATKEALKGLGCKVLLIDEAFAASSMKNMPEVGTILDDMIKEGMQGIIISQSSLLYQNLPRREIHLHLDTTIDPKADTVVLDGYKDY